MTGTITMSPIRTDLETLVGEDTPLSPVESENSLSCPDEQIYRFPGGRTAVEIIPDISGTFCLRLLWYRGKAVVPLFESTPFRPIGEVLLGGQTFPLFLSRHVRKKRNSVLLTGKRKTGHPTDTALRYEVHIEGREDRLDWTWRIGTSHEEGDEATVSILLPFAPGDCTLLRLPGAYPGVCAWINEVAVTIVVTADARSSHAQTFPLDLTADAQGVRLTLEGIDLTAGEVNLCWEFWLAPARTDTEARGALMCHLADAADRAQRPVAAVSPNWLTNLSENAVAALMAEDAVEKRGMDRLVYRASQNNEYENSKTRYINGVGADIALASGALLAHFYVTGDDALRRRARLLARGVCDFQINTEQSPNWGAIWDAAPDKKNYTDNTGGKTLSIVTTARAAKGLQILHNHFGTEILSRTALAGTQWLMLKLDRDGHLEGERWEEEGGAIPGGSPWVIGETLIPLVETFRRTNTDVFLKTAMRVVAALKEGLADTRLLPFESASTEQLAAAIEGILLVSREYENQEMIALAQTIGCGLRARRTPSGTLIDPPGIAPVSPLAPTLAGARAALALARIDPDPLYLTIAIRALRAAGRLAAIDPESLTIADQTALASLPLGLLLTVGARAANCVADRDLLTLTRGYQVFQPDPSTREYVRVTTLDGEPVDHIALVCHTNLQVLTIVLAPPGVDEVILLKNNRRPFAKNLLNGEYDQRYRLAPLGDGTTAMMAVLLADT